jgi:hypothetical protein
MSAEPNPANSAIHGRPSGKYVYVCDSLDALGGISAYTIASTGALTPNTGSPFTTLVNGGPVDIAIHPNGTSMLPWLVVLLPVRRLSVS